jgi:23S rRNA (adenine2503-C2)-methyltransferase
MTALRILDTASESGPAGITVKFRFGLADGLSVETVAVPMFGGTYTACVSSQVGCARACAFCETGTSGLSRNLSAAEIVGQVESAAEALGIRFRNVVFMGMGEPLDNPEGVFAALETLRDPRGLGYSQERITICTAGHVEGIRRLRGLGLKRLNLSVSLASARDGLRDRLMPINRTWPLAALAEALAAYPMRRNFVLGVNYCLLPGVNDATEDLDAAAAFIGKIGRALVNVIPYNPGRTPIGRAPSESEIVAFREGLAARGVPVRRRIEKGRSLMAACGQLGGLS